jgi:hypothetical protein
MEGHGSDQEGVRVYYVADDLDRVLSSPEERLSHDIHEGKPVIAGGDRIARQGLIVDQHQDAAALGIPELDQEICLIRVLALQLADRIAIDVEALDTGSVLLEGRPGDTRRVLWAELLVELDDFEFLIHRASPLMAVEKAAFRAALPVQYRTDVEEGGPVNSASTSHTGGAERPQGSR